MGFRVIRIFPILFLGFLLPRLSFADGTWSCDPFTGPNCGQAINDVFMVAPGEAWAVGDHGLILHKVNGEWVHVDSPTTGDLKRIEMTTNTQGQTVGWAVGEDVTLIHYDGSSWSLAAFVGSLPNADTGADLFDLDLLDAENGWAVGVYGWQNDFEAAIFALREGVWEDYAASLYFNDVEMLSPTDGWAVGQGGRIMHYDGVTWQRVPSPVDVDLFALDMISANEGWAVGKTGHILHYLNGTWDLQDNSDYVYYYGIDMISGNEGWAVGSVGHTMHYLNGVWTRRIYSTGFLRAVDMLDAADGWAVGEFGQIHHYDGSTWALDSTAAEGLYALQMLSASKGWAMGGDGAPHIQYYNGSVWTEVPFSGASGSVHDLDMISESEGWAVGEEGLLLHYQAGNWTQAASPTSVTLRGVDMISAAEGWAVGDGVILHYMGGNWEVYADSTPVFDEELYALDIVGPDDVWAVGDKGGMVQWDGVNWTMVPSPIYDPGSSWNELLDIDMVAADEGWATGTAELYIPPFPVVTPVLLRYTGTEWELWTQLGGGDFVHMLSPTEGWFGYDGAVYHFQDQNGVPEESDFSPVYTPQDVYNVHFLSSEEGMATSHEGTDYLLHYQDGKWYDEQIARRFTLQDVDVGSNDEAWAVGSYDFEFTDPRSTILHYANGTWVDYSKDPPLFDLDMLSASDGWAVGGDERQGAIYHYDGLEWTRALTLTYRLNAVHMLNATEGWAVGYNGTIYHYSTAGEAASGTWQEVPSPTPFELFDVHAVAANDVWAVGQNGRILHLGGGDWTLYESPTDGQIYTIQMVSPTEGWAFGNGAAIHYLDGVWSDASAPAAFYDLDMLASDSGWAVGWNSVAYYDGEDWTEVPVPFSKRWRGIHMVSAGEGWIVGEDGFILQYNGSNWQIAGGPTEGDLQAVDMLSADEGWAIGNGTILHYTGGSWQAVVANRPTEKVLHAIDMTAGGSEGWAVGQGGVMLRYQNGAWQKAANATTNSLNSVHMLSGTEGWAVGEYGTILAYNGSSWQYTGGQVTKNLNDLYMLSSTAGWAVGDGATLLHFDDANWNPVTVSTAGDMQAIDMASASVGWIGIGAAFLKYQDGSWDWPFYGPPYLSAYAIQTLSGASAWAVGESADDQSIAKYANDEWEYYASPTGRRLNGLHLLPGGSGWAVGEGVILKYSEPDRPWKIYLSLIHR